VSNETPITINPTHLAALTPAGRQSFADALAKHGGHSADAIAAAMGAPPAAVVPPVPATDTLGITGGPTVGSLEAERAAGMKAALAPADPAGYHLTHANANAISPTDLAKQDSEYKSGFAHMGLNASMSQVLASALTETAAHFARPGLTEAQLKSEFLQAGSDISRMTNSKEIVRLAQVAQDAMPEAFRTSLYNKFALHSQAAMVALSSAGRLLEMKAKAK
jgi:hypothetical protein